MFSQELNLNYTIMATPRVSFNYCPYKIAFVRKSRGGFFKVFGCF
jgi:hypothetical protein